MRTPFCSVVLLLAAAHQLPAQLKSVPVYAVTAARPGWAAALDYASGLNDASGHARHLGGRVTGTFGRLQLTVGGGVWHAGRTTSAQWGGTTLLRLVGGRSGGLALHALAGVGYARAGPVDTATTYLTLPLGIAVTKTGFETSRGAVTPWLVARFEVDRVSYPAVRASQNGAGVSGGIAAVVQGRLGVHAALDWLRLFERSGVSVTLPGGSRVTAGVGVHVLLSGAPRG